MGTGYRQLFPGERIDTNETENNAAIPQMVVSSGTPPSNAPKLAFQELSFNGTTDQHVIFPVILFDYVSGGTLKWNGRRASGTGAADVVMKGAVAAITAGAAEIPSAKIFNTVATGTTAVGTTAQALVTGSITLTMDSAATGDDIYIMFGRDANNASDTLDGVAVLVTRVWLEYTN